MCLNEADPEASALRPTGPAATVLQKKIKLELCQKKRKKKKKIEVTGDISTQGDISKLTKCFHGFFCV